MAGGVQTVPLEGQAGLWSRRAHFFVLCFLPILVLLSHRNIVAAMMLMGIAAAFYPKIVPAGQQLLRPARLAEAGGAGVLLWLLVFCFYALLSTLWTPVPERWPWSFKIFFFYTLAGAALWMGWQVGQIKDVRNKLVVLFVVVVLLAAFLMGIEGLSGGWLRKVIPPDSGRPDKDIVSAARGTTIAIFMYFPALVMLLKGLGRLGQIRLRWRVLVGVLAGFSLLAAAATLTVAANVGALVFGAVAAFVAWGAPRLAVRLMLIGLAMAFLLTPFCALLLPPIDVLAQAEIGEVSWVQRLNIYRYTVDYIFSSLGMFLFGGGVSYAWSLSEADSMVQLKSYGITVSLMPTHPHNIFLQIWLEFGLLGIGIILMALRQAGRWLLAQSLSTAQAVCVCGLGTSFFVFAFVDMSLWTPWRFAAPAFSLYGLSLCWRRLA